MVAAFSKSKVFDALSRSPASCRLNDSPRESRKSSTRTTSVRYSSSVQPLKQGARHIFISEYTQPGNLGSGFRSSTQRRILKKSSASLRNFSAAKRERNGP